jgi:Na+/H+ antiporter NhaA
MALFVANLALSSALLASAKTGVLVGSAISGALGMLLLAIFAPRAPRVAES